MRRIYNKDTRLESHSWFPYIAWALVFGFAFFVFELAGTISEKTKAIGEANIDEDAYLVPIEELRRNNISN